MLGFLAETTSDCRRHIGIIYEKPAVRSALIAGSKQTSYNLPGFHGALHRGGFENTLQTRCGWRATSWKYTIRYKQEVVIGECVERLPHSCGTRKGLQVFIQDDGKVDGWCFNCANYVRHPYGEEKTAEDIPKPEKPSEEQIQAYIAEIKGFPVVDLKHRKLRNHQLDYYGIKVGLSEKDGITPYATYYPYRKKGELVGYKCKIIDKKRIFSIGNLKDVDLFGWEEAKASGAQKILIVEGEDDAVAGKSILDKFTDKNP